MKSLIILGMFMLIVFISGVVPIADAHPHATIDLLESHSHNNNDGNFKENFLIHNFEHVMISTFDWFKVILFG